MTAIYTFSQYATEKRAYQQDIIGDTISAAVWSIAPTGPTVTEISEAGTSTVCHVSGVTAGSTYTLTCTITCAGGQIVVGRAKIKGKA